MSVADEILNIIDIVDIISADVDLKRNGKNYFGICPFHDDNSPSMSVSPQKQIFKCFSCGASGNAITFVRDYHKISYAEALSRLGKQVGIRVDVSKRIEKQHSIYDDVTKFYNLSLLHGQNNHAKKYLQQRSINEELIKKYHLGYSSRDNGSLREYLESKYSREQIIFTNLFDENLTREFFDERLIFPIANHKAEIVGYSGRALNNSTNKYINSPQSDVFKKSELLYNYHNLDFSKEYLIITEGFFDVIRLDSAGFSNSVGTMGTAFTKEHVQMVKKFKKVYLCFDGDQAGLTASLETFKLLRNHSMIYNIKIPSSEDVDSYLLKEGHEKFLYLLQTAKIYELYLLENMIERYLKEQKEEQKQHIIKFYETIKDTDLQIEARLLLENNTNLRLKSVSMPKRNYTSSVNQLVFDKSIESSKFLLKLERDVISAMYCSLDNTNFFTEHIQFLSNNSLNLLAELIITYYENNKNITLEELIVDNRYTKEEQKLLLKEVTLMKETVIEHNSQGAMRDYLFKILDYRMNVQIDRLNKQLTLTDNLDEKRQILHDLNKLIAQRNNNKSQRRELDGRNKNVGRKN